jgi:hypothetical protein
MYQGCSNETLSSIILGEVVVFIDAPADGAAVQRTPWVAAGLIASLKLSQTCEQVSFRDA